MRWHKICQELKNEADYEAWLSSLGLHKEDLTPARDMELRAFFFEKGYPKREKKKKPVWSPKRKEDYEPSRNYGQDFWRGPAHMHQGPQATPSVGKPPRGFLAPTN